MVIVDVSLTAPSDGRPLAPQRSSARSARPWRFFELGAGDEHFLVSSSGGGRHAASEPWHVPANGEDAGPARQQLARA